MIGDIRLMSPDVVIVGAGISGCASAYELTQLGFKVEVLEKYRPAAMGSGWALGGVRQSGRDRSELPLATYSVRKWSSLDEELGAETRYLQHGNLRQERDGKYRLSSGVRPKARGLGTGFRHPM